MHNWCHSSGDSKRRHKSQFGDFRGHGGERHASQARIHPWNTARIASPPDAFSTSTDATLDRRRRQSTLHDFATIPIPAALRLVNHISRAPPLRARAGDGHLAASVGRSGPRREGALHTERHKSRAATARSKLIRKSNRVDRAALREHRDAADPNPADLVLAPHGDSPAPIGLPRPLSHRSTRSGGPAHRGHGHRRRRGAPRVRMGGRQRLERHRPGANVGDPGDGL